MMTGVAMGKYNDLYEARKYFVKENKTFAPHHAKTEKYEKYYKAYKNIYDAVRPIVRDINE